MIKSRYIRQKTSVIIRSGDTQPPLEIVAPPPASFSSSIGQLGRLSMYKHVIVFTMQFLMFHIEVGGGKRRSMLIFIVKKKQLNKHSSGL